MEINIDFSNVIHPVGTIKTLVLLLGRQHFCQKIVDSKSEHTIQVHYSVSDAMTIEHLNTLRSLGCKIRVKKYIINELMELVSLSMQLGEPDVAQQVEECITFLTLKNGNT